MTDKKTLAIFGAGSGLGVSLAKHFGQRGYRIALVARTEGKLAAVVAELEAEGIEATAFPADMTDVPKLGYLTNKIEADMGPIHSAVYAPVSADVGFVPAVDLDGKQLQDAATLFAVAPVEIIHSILPGMIARGDGAVVIVGGLTAVMTMPGMSGVGPMMAAARNYILTLNAELQDKGVFAGNLNIGAMIARSTGMAHATSGGATLDPRFPVVDPDDLAGKLDHGHRTQPGRGHHA